MRNITCLSRQIAPIWRFPSLAILLVTMSVAAPALADSLTYRNDRFGTTIRFPTTLFDTLTQPSADANGQTFLGRENAALIVYASRNERFEDLAATARGQLDRITLDRVTRNWFAISGFDADGDVYYQRTERGANGVLHTAVLRYPRSQKERIDPHVGRIMRTLSGP